MIPIVIAIALISGTGPLFRKPAPAELDFTITTATSNSIVSTGGTSNVTISDANFTQYTAATYNPGYQLSASVTGSSGLKAGNVKFASINPSIATVDAAGNVTRVTDGTANVNVSIDGLAKQATLSMTQIVGGTTSVFSSWVNGSLAGAVQSATDGLKANGTNLQLFSVRNDSTATYAYNPSCWAASLDFSCVSVWNSYGWNGGGGIVRALTMVTPQYGICANHFALPVGTVVRLVTKSGATVSGTVATSTRIGSTDINLTKLTGTIGGITPASVFPSTVSNNIKTPGLATIYLNQNRLVGEVSGNFTGGPTTTTTGTTSASSPYYVQTITGDSGCPLFANVSGTLVLLSTFYSAAGGDSVSYYLSSINSAMTSGSITPINLNSYPSY